MVNPERLEDVLEAYPALRAAPSALHDAIRERGRPFDAGVAPAVFEEGAPATHLLLLTSGRFKLTRTLGGGRQLTIYRVEPGMFCAVTVAALLGGFPCVARAAADPEAHGVAVPRRVALLLFDAIPRLRHQLFALLASQLASVMMHIDDLAGRPLDQRVAAVLLAGGRSVRTTHQGLADDVGSVREVVSRILEDFAGHGVVRLARGRIEIVDPQALRERATAPRV
jgi:CRP/FNR family transcriptional regulator